MTFTKVHCRPVARLAAVLLAGFGMLGPAAAQMPLISPRTGAPPAPSEITVHLLAVAQPTVAFLERSSRLAEDHAASRRLRAFARTSVTEQAHVAEALALAAAPTPVGGDPLDAAAVASASVDEGAETILSVLPRFLRTPGAQAVAADRTIAAAGAAEFAAMSALDGSAFDARYIATQIEGLRALAALYRDYVQNGDDPTLRAVTVHALPRIMAELARLKQA